MWHLTSDKSIPLPGNSKPILVSDGTHYSLVSVENFLRYADKPYSEWSLWMEIPPLYLDTSEIDKLVEEAYDADLSVANTNWTDWDNAQDEIADAFEKGFRAGWNKAYGK